MLRHRLPALLLALAVASSARAADDPRRFNLACVGRAVTTGQRGRTDEPSSTLASVDLTTLRFCWRHGPCRPMPIRSATPDRIVLRNENTPQISLTYEVRLPKGDYSSDIRLHLTPPPDVVGHEQGTCRKLPFTPF